MLNYLNPMRLMGTGDCHAGGDFLVARIFIFITVAKIFLRGSFLSRPRSHFFRRPYPIPRRSCTILSCIMNRDYCYHAVENETLAPSSLQRHIQNRES